MTLVCCMRHVDPTGGSSRRRAWGSLRRRQTSACAARSAQAQQRTRGAMPCPSQCAPCVIGTVAVRANDGFSRTVAASAPAHRGRGEPSSMCVPYIACCYISGPVLIQNALAAIRCESRSGMGCRSLVSQRNPSPPSAARRSNGSHWRQTKAMRAHSTTSGTATSTVPARSRMCSRRPCSTARPPRKATPKPISGATRTGSLLWGTARALRLRNHS